MKIAVIGVGAYSLSLSMNLLYNELYFWSESKTIVSEYKKTKKLDSIIKGVKFDKKVKISNSYEEVLENANMVILMTSSAYIEEVAKAIKPYIKKSTYILVGTKGILNNGIIISDMLKKTLNHKKIAFISGPTFAADLINKDVCGLNIACNTEYYQMYSKIFTENIYLEHTLDTFGLELCGSIKNVFAIGSGIIDGLKMGRSTNALYITKLASEMSKMYRRLDCYKETIYSLCGLGDLLLTCGSLDSRNYSLGKIIATKKKKDIEKYLKDNTCEGYYTLDAINDLFNKKKIKFPIINALYDIVYNNESPNTLIDTIIYQKITKPKK